MRGVALWIPSIMMQPRISCRHQFKDEAPVQENTLENSQEIRISLNLRGDHRPDSFKTAFSATLSESFFQ